MVISVTWDHKLQEKFIELKSQRVKRALKLREILLWTAPFPGGKDASHLTQQETPSQLRICYFEELFPLVALRLLIRPESVKQLRNQPSSLLWIMTGQKLECDSDVVPIGAGFFSRFRPSGLASYTDFQSTASGIGAPWRPHSASHFCFHSAADIARDRIARDKLRVVSGCSERSRKRSVGASAAPPCYSNVNRGLPSLCRPLKSQQRRQRRTQNTNPN